jgi:hypothetical protein
MSGIGPYEAALICAVALLLVGKAVAALDPGTACLLVGTASQIASTIWAFSRS